MCYYFAEAVDDGQHLLLPHSALFLLSPQHLLRARHVHGLRLPGVPRGAHQHGLPHGSVLRLLLLSTEYC